jgi:hypothetical protein
LSSITGREKVAEQADVWGLARSVDVLSIDALSRHTNESKYLLNSRIWRNALKYLIR